VTSLLLAAALVLGAGSARPDLSARPPAPAPAPGHGGDTRCAACHTADGWKKVTFAHERTGFPLLDRHKEVACAACHEGGDFSRPIARNCAACHRDVHAGRMGQRCDRCHQPTSFKEAAFDVAAHRRTGFPLTGRHASLPCEECHGNRRDRSFARPIVDCFGCHQSDYEKTALDPQALNHITAGFPTDCRSCHGPWRFYPGKFAAHDACFAINSGPHAGISCRKCHTTSIPTYVAGQPMTCTATPAPDCISCHSCASHPTVAGFQCSDPRCYECHRFSSGTGVRVIRPGGVR
jgi:hypothetical protein